MNAIKLSLITVAAGLLASTSAVAALTLTTTGWTADARLTFGADAINTAVAAGVELSPAGTSKRLADAMGPDFNGVMVPVPVYNFPVTKASVNVPLNLKITAVSGLSAGAGVKMVRFEDAATSAGLANFDLDFVKDILYADVYTPQGTTTRMPLYKFTDNNDQKIALSGFNLTMKGSIKNMIFTPTAVDAIAIALELSDVLKATLVTSNWGGIVIDVNSKSRAKTNATPLTREGMGIPLAAPAAI